MFELFDHTADLGMRVRAPDLGGLFRDAARGLFAMIVEPEPHGEPEGLREFELQGERHDFLLLDWLNELLWLYESERRLLGRFEVSVSAGHLRARAAAFAFDPSVYHLLREVKAITYHGLTVESDERGWLAEVIVDI